MADMPAAPTLAMSDQRYMVGPNTGYRTLQVCPKMSGHVGNFGPEKERSTGGQLGSCNCCQHGGIMLLTLPISQLQRLSHSSKARSN